jgi:hypothetical protein
MRKYIPLYEDWKHNISVYDVDDTLVKTDTHITVYDKKTGKTKKYSTHKFSNIERKDHWEISFDGFEDIEHIQKGKLLKDNVAKMLNDYKDGKHIAIVSGRAKIEPIRVLLKRIGVHVPDHLIYPVSRDNIINSKKEMANKKAEAVKDLIKKGYTNFIYYDDTEENLLRVKDLEKSYPVVITTVLT